jgi:hypothetical protein
MARRFNRKSTSAVATRKTPNTVNLAGGYAFTQEQKLEFASILLTSFLKNQFYRSADETINRIQQLMRSVDPKFAAQAAVYARKVFGMRSVSHLVAAEIGALVHGSDWGRNFFREIIQRPDDVTEILAAYMTLYKDQGIPNAMKKGMGEALSRFNAYQLGKYKGEQNDITLVDAVNLLHPLHTVHLKALINGTLKSPETWEVKMSEAGQKAKDDKDLAKRKAKVWKDLLNENQLGYFALLRNLRNIAEQAPVHLELALEKLVDREAIKSSLVLPFRFTKAIEFLKGNRAVVSALNKALDISMDNVPKLKGNTLIVIDHSGSMGGYPIEQAALFGSVMFKAWENSEIMYFSNDAKYVPLNPQDSLSSLKDSIINGMAGGGTNFEAPILRANKKYDRMVFLSDMQGWGGTNAGAPTRAMSAYRNKFKADPFIYSFDLGGYGSGMFSKNKLLCMAGISEKVFDLMSLMEKDKNALVHVIEQVKFDGSVNRFVDGVLSTRTDSEEITEDE